MKPTEEQIARPIAKVALLIQGAIERYDDADRAYRDAQADATADADDRDAVKEQKLAAERAFAWQLENIRVLLADWKERRLDSERLQAELDEVDKSLLELHAAMKGAPK